LAGIGGLSEALGSTEMQQEYKQGGVRNNLFYFVTLAGVAVTQHKTASTHFFFVTLSVTLLHSGLLALVV
jgi:hypothetical protein